jgi:hypothetical protein
MRRKVEEYKNNFDQGKKNIHAIIVCAILWHTWGIGALSGPTSRAVDTCLHRRLTEDLVLLFGSRFRIWS